MLPHWRLERKHKQNEEETKLETIQGYPYHGLIQLKEICNNL